MVANYIYVNGRLQQIHLTEGFLRVKGFPDGRYPKYITTVANAAKIAAEGDLKSQWIT